MELGLGHHLETLQVNSPEVCVGRVYADMPIGHCTFPWGLVVVSPELQLPESQEVARSLAGGVYILDYGLTLPQGSCFHSQIFGFGYWPVCVL